MQPGTKLFNDTNFFSGRQRRRHLTATTHKAVAAAAATVHVTNDPDVQTDGRNWGVRRSLTNYRPFRRLTQMLVQRNAARGRSRKQSD